MTDMSDAELLGALGVEAKEDKKKTRTPKEERIIAGFEEIQKFVEENSRVPAHGEGNDIFERLYATRLDQIKKQSECYDLVADLDHQGLLGGTPVTIDELPAEVDDEELLAQLGVSKSESDVTVLKHVRTRAEIKAAEEIASRTKCEDFDTFKPLFIAVQNDIDTGNRETIRYRKEAGFAKTDIKKNQFIILAGQTAYIADYGETIKAPNGEDDARLRVVYSNGTESDILLRSLIRAMYKDETSRLISDPSAGPLFSGEVEVDDLPSGTIYVLRSQSDHPTVRNNRQVLHKIGVTGGKVEKRIANARLDATFLLADVEVIATYKLANINRTKMENLIHKFFKNAQLDIEIKDRFGNPISPREWFLVPLHAIDEAIEKIQNGSIGDYVYDAGSAKLKRR